MRGALWLFASALALTLAMAAPVLQAPSERLFGREIVGRHEAPFIVIDEFEKPARDIYTQPVTDYAGAAAAAVLGNGVAAYNVVVLATFPLAALFAYLFALHLTGSRPAAWLVGLLYAFAPYHLAQSAYHSHGAQTQWLPLYLLALWLSVERASLRRSLFLGLTVALVTLSSFYYGLMAALLTPLALLGFWLVRRFHGGDRAAGLERTILTLGLIAVTGVAYVLAFAPQVVSGAAPLTFPREDLVQYGARWWSYLTPPVGHPLFGAWSERLWSRQGIGGLLEQQITVGFGLLCLAAVAVGVRLRGHRRGGLVSVPVLSLIAGGAFLISLSPPATPGPLASAWPATWVHGVLPMFRAYARFSVVVFLAVGVLAVIGGGWLWRRGGAWRFVAAGLLVLAAVELTPLPPFRWRQVLPTEAHRWMARQPAPWRLLDCHRPTPAVAWSILRFLPQPGSLLSPAVPDCAEPGLPGKLAALGYSHLLLRADSPEQRWYDGPGPRRGWREAASFEDSRVLRVTAPAARVYPDLWRGFSWREYAGRRTFRWLGPSGEWRLVNRDREPLTVRLEVELWSFGGERRLELGLDGGPPSRLLVGSEPATYEVGPLVLPPGRSRLSFSPLEPPAVPDEVLGNGDTRPLSVAVGSWRWTEMAAVERTVP